MEIDAESVYPVDIARGQIEIDAGSVYPVEIVRVRSK